MYFELIIILWSFQMIYAHNYSIFTYVKNILGLPSWSIAELGYVLL